jgi:hypothetical protein
MAESGSFYVTLFSNASQDTFKRNTHAAYTIDLARPVDLGSGGDRWEVGICELSYPKPPTKPGVMYIAGTHILVYLDLIAPQYVGRQLVRCARTLMYPTNDGQHVFENVYNVPVEKRRFHTISAELLTVEGKRVSFEDSKTPSKLVLHFRRVSPWW